MRFCIVVLAVWTALAATMDVCHAQRRDSAGIVIVQSSRPAWQRGQEWSVGTNPTLTIGVADGPPELTFSQIAAVINLGAAGLIVADASIPNLKYFDSNGRFIRSVGRRGQGPSDFGDITRAWATRAGNVAVYSSRNGRVSIFGQTGDLIETITLPSRASYSMPFGDLPQGGYVTASPRMSILGGEPGTVLQDTQDFALRTSTGAVVRDFVAVPGQQRLVYAFDAGSIRYPFVPFIPRPSAATAADGVYVGSGVEPEFRFYAYDGTLRRIVRWSAADSQLDDRHRQAYADSVLRAPGSQRSLAGWRRFLADVEYPPRMPAFQRLAIDPLGYVWTQRYSDRNVWDVFGSDGGWLGAITFPDGMTVSEVGDDHVTGVHRDSDGVERAVILRLTRR
jgi:hypothetical protein